MKHIPFRAAIVSSLAFLLLLTTPSGSQAAEPDVFRIDPELAELYPLGLTAPSVKARFTLVDEDGQAEHFMTNEVVLLAPDPSILDNFMGRYGAELIAGPEPPEPPAEIPAERLRQVEPPPLYHLAVDVSDLWLPPADDLAIEAGLVGKYQVSSRAGLDLISLL